VGYLLAVDHDAESGESGWVPSSFSLVFESEGKAFYRCEQTTVLDDTVGDVHSLIFEREQAVLRGAETAILEHQAELCMVSEALGELDVIIALAEVAEVSHRDKGAAPQLSRPCRNVDGCLCARMLTGPYM
jgi:DNA mismatch repair ATPase MutS